MLPFHYPFAHSQTPMSLPFINKANRSALLIVLLLPALALAASCNAACNNDDIFIDLCEGNFGPDSVTADPTRFVQCLDTASVDSSGAGDIDLGNCIVCDQDDLGGHPLYVYQIFYVIVNALDTQNMASALMYYTGLPQSEVVAYYSATLMAPLQESAGITPVMSSSSSTTTTTTTSTTQSQSSSSQMIVTSTSMPSTTSTSSSSTTSSQTTTTMTPTTSSGSLVTKVPPNMAAPQKSFSSFGASLAMLLHFLLA